MKRPLDTLARRLRAFLTRVDAKDAPRRDRDDRFNRLMRLRTARRRASAKENGYVNAWRRWDA